jgi:hypothetical protein
MNPVNGCIPLATGAPTEANSQSPAQGAAIANTVSHPPTPGAQACRASAANPRRGELCTGARMPNGDRSPMVLAQVSARDNETQLRLRPRPAADQTGACCAYTPRGPGTARQWPTGKAGRPTGAALGRRVPLQSIGGSGDLDEISMMYRPAHILLDRLCRTGLAPRLALAEPSVAWAASIRRQRGAAEQPIRRIRVPDEARTPVSRESHAVRDRESALGAGAAMRMSFMHDWSSNCAQHSRPGRD